MDEHQLFLNIECKLLDKYGWGTHMEVNRKHIDNHPNVDVAWHIIFRTKIEGYFHTLLKSICLAKIFPIWAPKLCLTNWVKYFDNKCVTMYSPQVSAPRLHSLVVFETEPLQHISSCMAREELVELYKIKITRWSKKHKTCMLNYEKTLVIVAYHTNFEGLVKLHAEEYVVS